MKFLKSKKQSNRSQDDFRGLTHNSPFAYVESYKSIRTNLDFMLEKDKCKKIIVTSAQPKEGKSTFVLNLAITLSEDNNRVLIIDCDLRKPVMQKYVHPKKAIQHGISAVIKTPFLLTEAIKHHAQYNIDFIFAGKLPPNPIELLGSPNMKDILESLSVHYDYIICDSPPALLMSDAAILSQNCDAVILVIRQNYSTRAQVKATIKNLDVVKANIIGAVLTQYDIKSAPSANQDYYYNYYDDSSESGDNAK